MAGKRPVLLIMDNTRLLTDLFKAYYNARRNKRNTINQLKFELHFEQEIFKLYDEIKNRVYVPSREIAFIINKPVLREIFAADFRDRVVHHLLFGYISPVIEKYLIYDCYSCRKGKGTSFGIKRAAKFMRSCSDNYQKDCYIMQMDISGYFMAIERKALFHKTNNILQAEYRKRAVSGSTVAFDTDLVDFLLRKTIFHNPAGSCVIRGKGSDWNNLPCNKSLFYASAGCGLAIGNLSSQLFGNVFLNDFDHWIKHNMKFNCYGRYVDDFFIMHNDKRRLLNALPIIADYLKTHDNLILHPNKTKINHQKRGFLFLGTIIKPYRIYIGRRVKGNFYQAIEKLNRVVVRRGAADITYEEKTRFVSIMNSYLGIMKHYSTLRIRRKIIKNRISGKWWDMVCIIGCWMKFAVRDFSRYSTG